MKDNKRARLERLRLVMLDLLNVVMLGGITIALGLGTMVLVVRFINWCGGQPVCL